MRLSMVTTLGLLLLSFAGIAASQQAPPVISRVWSSSQDRTTQVLEVIWEPHPLIRIPCFEWEPDTGGDFAGTNFSCAHQPFLGTSFKAYATELRPGTKYRFRGKISWFDGKDGRSTYSEIQRFTTPK